MRKVSCFVLVAAWAAVYAAADQPRPAVQPARARVAVGRFEVPEALAKEVTPGTLTDLLWEAGTDGLRYEAVAAAGDLDKVVGWYRVKNKLPTAGDLKLSKADFTKVVEQTRFLVLPTVSRLGEEWVMTATVVSLRSGETRTLKAVLKGGGTARLPELIAQLWIQLESPTARSVLVGHNEVIIDLAISTDGKTLATASTDRTARLWDVATGKERAVLRGHTSRVDHVRFSPDGKTLATIGSDDSVRLWDASGKEILVLRCPRILSIACFSPDGKFLATSSNSNSPSTRIFETKVGKEALVISNLQMSIKNQAFSRDGKLLALYAADNTARVWDVVGKKELLVVKGHEKPVRSAAFSPDSKLLATGSFDKTLKIWDITTGQQGICLSTLDGYPLLPTMTFSPDGKYIVSGTASTKTMRVWNLSTREERTFQVDGFIAALCANGSQ